MKNSKTSIQPDGSVWYKHYTVESSRPKKDGGSFFMIEGTEWSPERSPKPKKYTAKNGQTVTKYYYESKKEAQRHSSYMWTHKGENINEKLSYKRRNKLEEIFK